MVTNDTPLRVYLDSNVFIYIVDGEPGYQTQARYAIASLPAHATFCTSEMTVGECLRGALRLGNRGSAESYLDLLQDQAFVSLHPVTLQLIKRAAEIGVSMGMKLLDALHVATAEALGCAIFLTNDRGIRAPAGMEIRRLSEEG
ncbi:PIN domain-containing protein [Rhizobium sp. LjRoot30]|uniref:type II toxin-antitoxin system VapC family toxin n=1 Tax=Rhizobium sp. LjRoot30 TaxID=3342320 RepID=UPI003ED12C4D